MASVQLNLTAEDVRALATLVAEEVVARLGIGHPGNGQAGAGHALNGKPAAAPAALRRLLKPTEAAAYLSLGKTRLAELTASGELVAVKDGRLVRYRPADLDDWAARHSTGGTAANGQAGDAAGPQRTPKRRRAAP